MFYSNQSVNENLSYDEISFQSVNENLSYDNIIFFGHLRGLTLAHNIQRVKRIVLDALSLVCLLRFLLQIPI
ncbi:unnamed protein product [Peronospora belbahrii]|uniref:Uncharacterized protein n=1 Tax=Peronospora belbahrii TaxID=622444 RepID=A0ABN8D5C8_9STRA|nr:unnamed protein product [Peronospora belbahrii]